MPAFRYAALDAKGRNRKGLLEGDTPRQVRQMLRERELMPLQVSEVAGRNSAGVATASGNERGGTRLGRIGATELALITRQLATLAEAGLPLEEALGAVSRHASSARSGGLLLSIRARVLEGHSLADALNDHPRVFPELYRATVAAGEQAGRLDVVLERLADYTENRQQIRQKTLLALVYPLLLTAVAIAIVGGLLIFVVPQVVQVFDGLDRQLPLLTRGLIAISDFAHDYGIFVLALLALTGLAFGYSLRRRAVRFRLQQWSLRLPLIGRLTRALNSARFARTFSILLASNVPVLEALRISAQVISHLPMRAAVEQAAVAVKEGGSLQRALSASGHFPPLTMQLIASGETSGRLEAMLERAANQQERECETLIAALLAVFEPLLILLMGAIVLVIVLAILLPIFDLNQMIS